MSLSETSLLCQMVASLIGGGAYAAGDIAGALAKAKEIRDTVMGHE